MIIDKLFRNSYFESPKRYDIFFKIPFDIGDVIYKNNNDYSFIACKLGYQQTSNNVSCKISYSASCLSFWERYGRNCI